MRTDLGYHYRKKKTQRREENRRNTTRTRYMRADVRCTGSEFANFSPLARVSFKTYPERWMANNVACKQFPTRLSRFGYGGGASCHGKCVIVIRNLKCSLKSFQNFAIVLSSLESVLHYYLCRVLSGDAAQLALELPLLRSVHAYKLSRTSKFIHLE